MKSQVNLGLLSLAVMWVSVTSAEGARELSPTVVNSATTQMRGPHQIFRASPQAISQNRLVLTLGGSTSLPTDFRFLQGLAQSLGFDVIGLDYPNMISTLQCVDGVPVDQVDPGCFKKFRDEVVRGVPSSHLVDVPPMDSILYRMDSLLRFLAAEDPHWLKYFDGTRIDWSKILIVGHSQGAGHAVYLSKMFAVDRVVVIGGPSDGFGPVPSQWIAQPGATAPERHFGLVHQDDFLFKREIVRPIFQALVGHAPELVKHNLIISDRQVNDGHNAVLQPSFSEEWKTLLLE